MYPEDKPFLLPEEQRLIGAVAGDLERWLEGKGLEQTPVSIAETYQHTIGQELHDNLGTLRPSLRGRVLHHCDYRVPISAYTYLGL